MVYRIGSRQKTSGWMRNKVLVARVVQVVCKSTQNQHHLIHDYREALSIAETHLIVLPELVHSVDFQRNGPRSHCRILVAPQCSNLSTIYQFLTEHLKASAQVFGFPCRCSLRHVSRIETVLGKLGKRPSGP